MFLPAVAKGKPGGLRQTQRGYSRSGPKPGMRPAKRTGGLPVLRIADQVGIGTRPVAKPLPTPALSAVAVNPPLYTLKGDAALNQGDAGPLPAAQELVSELGLSLEKRQVVNVGELNCGADRSWSWPGRR